MSVYSDLQRDDSGSAGVCASPPLPAPILSLPRLFSPISGCRHRGIESWVETRNIICLNHQKLKSGEPTCQHRVRRRRRRRRNIERIEKGASAQLED